ncbi:MAG TPA: MEDS domain-containing protein [Terriglobales bacterium]|nr:MEDS domain-containing protein [Terriglobales bacterium]
MFYRSQEALLEVLTPFIAEGLRKGERCFCAQKPDVIKRLLFDLRFIGIDTDREIRLGNLEFHTEDEVYFPDKRFEPEALTRLLLESIDDSVKRGYASFRTAGELSWTLEGRNECDQLIEYEKLVEQAYPSRPAIGICQYDMNKFPAQVLDSVLQIHRMQVFEPKPGSQYSSVGLGLGDCMAEIVADRLLRNPGFYYVVQQRFPREVVGWGVAPDFESAASEVEQLAREAP